MSTIVAGNFATKAQADGAIAALRGEGVSEERICTFALNPPGQHAAFPIGGDEDASRGAEHAGGGAAKGAAIGGAIGLGAGAAALPVAGPVGLVAGAGIGAYIGSFAGALSNMEDSTIPPEAGAARQEAGVLVAVETPGNSEQAQAKDVLRREGAREVEQTEGEWRDGRWVDFDPVPAPNAPGKPS